MNQDEFNRLSRAEQRAMVTKVFGEGTPPRSPIPKARKALFAPVPENYEPADRLRFTLLGPPRTKKNHRESLHREGPAYRKYNADAKDQLLRIRKLKDIDYNLNAQFYVDRYGKNADLIGLLQALADTLQDAGIVSNDRQFRGTDGSRKHDDHNSEPRTEIVLTPLSEAA